MVEVIVLRTGYFEMIDEKGCKAVCTISLVKDEKVNVLVDTGNVGEQEEIKNALKKFNLSVNDINFIVITHYHPDHIGNNCMFPDATFIDAVETFKGDTFTFFEDEYKITDEIKVIRTPGHYSNDDCSVIVKTEKGIIAITGDLFWKGQDDLPPFIFNKNQLVRTRRKIIKLADYIVPGHGNIFKVSR